MIQCMDKSKAKPAPAVKPPLAKTRGLKQENDFNYRSVIVSINFLANSTPPKAQFVVHQFAQFVADPKLPHNQAVKCVLKCFKGASMQVLILKPYS